MAFPEPRAISRHSAVIGTAIWVGWQLLADTFAPAVLFVLSPLVLIPLLLGPLVEDGDEARLIRTMVYAQLPCALTLPIGLTLAPGGLAMLACLPWAGWTVLAAVEAARRVRALVGERGGLAGALTGGGGELAIAAGLGFPLIGSVWLLCDRLAIEPLGFSPLIVLLTAVHFHHAGFTLPLMAGLLARWREDDAIWRWAALTIVVAVPLVAIGITFSPLLEIVGSALTVLGAMAVGVGMLLRAKTLPGIPGVLSALSGACLLAGMIFAASYALTEYLGTPLPDIQSMVDLHGAVNALGFGLLGAWTWHLRPA